MTRIPVVVQLAAVLGLLSCATNAGRDAADGGEAGADGAPSDIAQDRPQDVATDTATPTTFPPTCHYDCFGGTMCRNGVVTTTLFAPVPCEFFTGSCPVLATYT